MIPSLQTDETAPPPPSIFAPLNVIKSVISVALLTFSTALIMGLIFTNQTKIASTIHPAAAFITLWICAIWLTVIEGSLASIVGLASVNRELYRQSHKHAYRCSVLVHHGDNLDRYLLGCQFMVVLVVFAMNNAGGAIKGATLWGLPDVIITIFLNSGVAVIFFTVMIGQLNSQVNSSLCMLDYINNWFGVFTVYVAMGLEFSGILHASYLIRMIFCALAGKTIESQEPPRSVWQNVFFWLRVLFSVACLGYAFAVTLTALFQGKTTMWKGVPPVAAVILFFFLMSIVGLLEGTQIAYFAVSKLQQDERGTNLWAKKTCDILFDGKNGQPGVNLPSYMIGRQLCVVSCMFFIAMVTSTDVAVGEPTIFGVSDSVQKFFNTGLLGALITTIVGSIAWRLAASAFPIFFMSIFPAFLFVKISLWLEASGLLNGAWVLGWIHKKIAGFQRDEVYIGTAEDRAAKNMADNEDNLHTGAGHMVVAPVSSSRKLMMESDLPVSDYHLHSTMDKMEKGSGGTDNIATTEHDVASVE